MCTSRLTFSFMTSDVRKLAELNLPFRAVHGKLDSKTEPEEQKLFLFPSSCSRASHGNFAPRLITRVFRFQMFKKHNCTFLLATSKYCIAIQNMLNSETTPVSLLHSAFLFPKVCRHSASGSCIISINNEVATGRPVHSKLSRKSKTAAYLSSFRILLFSMLFNCHHPTEKEA